MDEFGDVDADDFEGDDDLAAALGDDDKKADKEDVGDVSAFVKGLKKAKAAQKKAAKPASSKPAAKAAKKK